MIQNSISVSPLAWYDSIDRQNHRNFYAYDRIKPVISQNRRVPPFQVIRPTSYDNLTEFKLHRLSDGTTIDIFASIISAGLKVDKTYYRNYSDVGITRNVSSGSMNGWGWTFGPAKNFKYVETVINAFSTTIPTAFNLKIKSSKTGAILAQSSLIIAGIVQNVNTTIKFELNNLVTNAVGANLWIEITSNGNWSTVGKGPDSILAFTPESNCWSSGGLNVPPSSIPPGEPGAYDGYVRTYRQELDYDIISYPSTLMFSDVTTEGNYYAEMSDGTNTWFSEVFCVKHYVGDLLKLTYWHDEAFTFPGGHIRYEYPYRNFFYFGTEIGKPSYDFEEVVQNRDGYKFIMHQISKKIYRFEIICNEPMLDALRIVRMHTFVTIEHKGILYKIDDIIFTEKWQEDGFIAVVEVEYYTDTVISKSGKGLIQSIQGDYDSTDYNEDYL